MNKYRIVYLATVFLWAVFVVAVLLFYGGDSQLIEQPEEDEVVQEIPQQTAVYETEAVPVEHDPVREDIPLDAETQRQLWQACEETGVTYELALAIIWKETNFRNVVGDNGKSFGYMQVQQKWHRDRMQRYGVTDLMDPYGNFLVGCDYIAELAERDRGIEWILHAYNGGPSYANKLAKAGKVSQYAKDVLDYLKILREEI